MDKKKQILIISFFFQPFNTIGAVRVSYFVKYLQDKDYIVHIVTAMRENHLNLNIAKDINTYYVRWPNADKLLNLSDKFPKCKLIWFLSRVLNKIFIPSATRLPEGSIYFWRQFAYKKARIIIKNNNISLIYTSSGPVSSAIIGSKLTQKYNIPWIPEFRDLWALNPYNGLNENKRNKQLKIEKKYLAHAKHIITVTNGFKNIIESIHKQKVSVIYNGYSDITVNDKTHNQRLTIIHLGTIYKNKRDPSILFNAVNQLKNENKITENDLTIKFYGSSNNYIKDLIEQYNIPQFVEICKTVSKNEALEIQKKSDVLLLLQWNNKNDRAIPGKLFEYMAYQKPILAICYPGEIKQILDKTSTGKVITELDEMKNFILNSVQNYKHNPSLGFQFMQKEIIKYSRKYQNKKLEEIIKKYI